MLLQKIGSRIFKKMTIFTHIYVWARKKDGPLPKQAAAIAVPHTFKKNRFTKTVQRNLVGKLYLQNPLIQDASGTLKGHTMVGIPFFQKKSVMSSWYWWANILASCLGVCGILHILSKGEYLWPAWVSGATLLAAIVVWHLRSGLDGCELATSPENVSRKSPPKKKNGTCFFSCFFLSGKCIQKKHDFSGDML